MSAPYCLCLRVGASSGKVGILCFLITAAADVFLHCGGPAARIRLMAGLGNVLGERFFVWGRGRAIRQKQKRELVTGVPRLCTTDYYD